MSLYVSERGRLGKIKNIMRSVLQKPVKPYVFRSMKSWNTMHEFCPDPPLLQIHQTMNFNRGTTENNSTRMQQHIQSSPAFRGTKPTLTSPGTTGRKRGDHRKYGQLFSAALLHSCQTHSKLFEDTRRESHSDITLDEFLEAIRGRIINT